MKRGFDQSHTGMLSPTFRSHRASIVRLGLGVLLRFRFGAFHAVAQESEK